MSLPHLPAPATEIAARVRSFAVSALRLRIDSVQRIREGGSRRLFYRLQGPGGSVVGAYGEDVPQLAAFVAHTRYFARQALPVPQLLAWDLSRQMYLMEDLGPWTLSAKLGHWSPAESLSALERCLRWLPALQLLGLEGWCNGTLPAAGEMDSAHWEADLRLFVERFASRAASQTLPLPADVEADLRTFARRLSVLPAQAYCLRDFQPRNIMWPERDAPKFIDYQDALRGPVAYDLVSLLYSPDAHLDEAAQGALREVYRKALSRWGIMLSAAELEQMCVLLIWARRLQALGAYARIVEEKGDASFLQKFPPALRTLRDLLQRGQFPQGLEAWTNWLHEVLAAANLDSLRSRTISTCASDSS